VSNRAPFQQLEDRKKAGLLTNKKEGNPKDLNIKPEGGGGHGLDKQRGKIRIDETPTGERVYQRVRKERVGLSSEERASVRLINIQKGLL